LNLAYALAERPAPMSSSNRAAGSSTDIDALIRRVDQALGADGQLL